MAKCTHYEKTQQTKSHTSTNQQTTRSADPILRVPWGDLLGRAPLSGEELQRSGRREHEHRESLWDMAILNVAGILLYGTSWLDWNCYIWVRTSGPVERNTIVRPYVWQPENREMTPNEKILPHGDKFPRVAFASTRGCLCCMAIVSTQSVIRRNFLVQSWSSYS